MTSDAKTSAKVRRNLNNRAIAYHNRHGVELDVIAIAAFYSAHDIATVRFGGDGETALRWMRAALEIMERDHAAQAKGKRND